MAGGTSASVGRLMLALLPPGLSTMHWAVRGITPEPLMRTSMANRRRVNFEEREPGDGVFIFASPTRTERCTKRQSQE